MGNDLREDDRLGLKRLLVIHRRHSGQVDQGVSVETSLMHWRLWFLEITRVSENGHIIAAGCETADGGCVLWRLAGVHTVFHIGRRRRLSTTSFAFLGCSLRSVLQYLSLGLHEVYDVLRLVLD